MTWLKNFYGSLEAAVDDGGLLERQGVENAARDADELELVIPAYAALTAWGEAGLDMMIQIALSGMTVKSKSAAMTVLSVLSSTGGVSAVIHVPASLAAKINAKVEPANIRQSAHAALQQLVLSLPTDDLLIPASQSLMHFSLSGHDAGAELVSALSLKWLQFGPPALTRYEEMLRAEASNETAFHDFFCQYPQFLDPMAVQVWSKPDFHGALEPDFVIRRADESYLLVEIECPAKGLVTRANQLSADATHAEKQVLDYEAFLAERMAEARTHFPGYSAPDCLVLVGNERELNDEQRRALVLANARRHNVRFAGFDWPLRRATSILANIGNAKIPVITRHRIT